ncbi:Holliday junction branch migration protein RuvA [Melioribacteraceae bacterium 4301-Me]|uniref:Holliday junction branch migration protein RuvA n=1 Tax=Pyranulibacter aquaticus TaxID=3163344 RepID=UPI00359903F0
MIGYLSGKIVSKKPTKIILDVNGVGYLVNISISTFQKLAEKQEASLYTFLALKENSLELYGFYTLDEKEMFEMLISVSGIGPKIAQSILSGIEIEELQEALRMNNLARLTAIPGIGKKTAERLLVELRDKVESFAEKTDFISKGSSNLKIDAVNALINLGYNLKIAERAVRAVLDKNPSIAIEDLIKEALASMSR